MKTTYGYVDKDADEIMISPLGDYETCTLTYEIQECGVDQEWFSDELKTLNPGFYRIDYNFEMVTEYGEYGSIDAIYPKVTWVKSMSPSVKAFCLWVFFKYIARAFYSVMSIFENCWRVDIDYGGYGNSKVDLFLHQALWYKYSGAWKEFSWGDNYKEIIIRGGY